MQTEQKVTGACSRCFNMGIPTVRTHWRGVGQWPAATRTPLGVETAEIESRDAEGWLTSMRASDRAVEKD